jgi:hypothetical protein
MASKRRQRRRSCTNKVRHATFDEAQRAARALFHNTEKHRSVYGCRFCGGFHIGRQPLYVKRLIDARQQRNAPH